MRKTKSAVRQPLNREIAEVEAKIPKEHLRLLQREADLREYSDWKYLDFLRGYLLGCVKFLHKDRRTFKRDKKREAEFFTELYYYLKVVLGFEDDLTSKEKKKLGIP